MKITVLIPTWRRPNSLARCIDGLKRQEQAPDEVLVVVREGDEQTTAILKTMQDMSLHLRVVGVAEQGLVAALNSGLGAVSGDIVAITDDDTVPRASWLAQIASHFAADGGLGGVGGRDWVHDGSRETEVPQPTVGLLRWYGRLIGNHHLGIGGPRPVDVLKGANMSFRCVALSNVRIDGRLRGVGNQVHTEIDLCFAVRSKGWKLLYDPTIVVDHYPAERPGRDPRSGPSSILEDAVHNETYLLLKWLPSWRKMIAVMYWVLVGTRSGPGIVLLVERLVREEDRAALVRRFAAAWRGRLRAVRTFMAGRRLN